MERIQQAFNNRSGRAAIIPFLTAGDPTFDTSLQLFKTVLAAGADIVEIGIPYSDPLADGPVIQAASLRSVENGFTLPRAFELTAHLRLLTDKGLVLFTYINPILQYGMKRFVTDAKLAGADGLIVPDVPMEESDELRHLADAAGVALIPLVTPTSGPLRIEQIVKNARGFIYCVSSLGVTGERAKMSDRVRDLVDVSRSFSALPVAVGFGVSQPEQAQNIAGYADGVIVGSAYIRRVEAALHGKEADITAHMQREIRTFTEQLLTAVK